MCFDKDCYRKTKNHHSPDLLLVAHERGFLPRLVCFDGWYASIDNLKLVRALGWYSLTRLKFNRQIRLPVSKLQPVAEV